MRCVSNVEILVIICEIKWCVEFGLLPIMTFAYSLLHCFGSVIMCCRRTSRLCVVYVVLMPLHLYAGSQECSFQMQCSYASHRCGHDTPTQLYWGLSLNVFWMDKFFILRSKAIDYSIKYLQNWNYSGKQLDFHFHKIIGSKYVDLWSEENQVISYCTCVIEPGLPL